MLTPSLGHLTLLVTLTEQLIPYVVDGPMAINLIKPKPAEINVHRLKTPLSFTKVPPETCPDTGKTLAAVLECDIDLFTNDKIRKLANMIRSYLKRIVIDVAFVIAKPRDQEEDEPSACLGCWRIDRVDFERCAVLPEATVDEIAQTVKETFADA